MLLTKYIIWRIGELFFRYESILIVVQWEKNIDWFILSPPCSELKRKRQCSMWKFSMSWGTRYVLLDVTFVFSLQKGVIRHTAHTMGSHAFSNLSGMHFPPSPEYIQYPSAEVSQLQLKKLQPHVFFKKWTEQQQQSFDINFKKLWNTKL